MWRTVWSTVGEALQWAKRHPVQSTVILASYLLCCAYVWFIFRPWFIDLDDYVIESAAGQAELAERVGSSFVLRSASGERIGFLCTVPKGRRHPQYCVDAAYQAGLADGEAVTVRYLRPPDGTRDAPLLLSIRGTERVYLSCSDQLRTLGLRAARYQALCEREPE